jgi:hypothetical protein
VFENANEHNVIKTFTIVNYPTGKYFTIPSTFSTLAGCVFRTP